MTGHRIAALLVAIALMASAGCGTAGGPGPDPSGSVPLPAALRPATATELIGNWAPADGRGQGAPHRPSIELRADGTYRGSDGCNGASGHWTSGPGGELHATSGPRTLMGCADMLDVPSWLAGAARAGFDGAVLVLLDDHGVETGRLRAL